MDQNNQPTTQTPEPVNPAATAPGPNVPPIASSSTPTSPTPPLEKKKMPMVMILLILAFVLLIGGVVAYLLLNKPTTQTTSLPVATPTVQPSPTMTAEEIEVNAIDAGATESSDLEDVQNEINSLTSPTTPAE